MVLSLKGISTIKSDFKLRMKQASIKTCVTVWYQYHKYFIDTFAFVTILTLFFESIILLQIMCSRWIYAIDAISMYTVQGVPERSIRKKFPFSTIEGALRAKIQWWKTSLIICLHNCYKSFWLTLPILCKHHFLIH